MTYLLHPHQSNTSDQLGGKARALAALHQTDLPIPAWFVLSPTAFYDSVNDTQRTAFDGTTNSAQIRVALDNLYPNTAVQAELAQAVAELCPNGENVAVRSSAPDEDGAQHSFAGQLESFLRVPPDEVVDRVVDVWRSGFSERIFAYRHERGLVAMPPAPAVIIQRMVNADVSGVAFSADPVTGRRDITVVSAVAGFGAALVSGQINADTYHIDRQSQIIRRNLVDESGIIHKNGRITNYQLPITKTITDAHIRTIAQLARRTEQFFGCPQDIEWAIEDGQLFLLQSRPITALATVNQTSKVSKTFEVSAEVSTGALNLWDNSNIAESYPGITTPLTFSFARRAYEEVYRQFCYMMGVPGATIADNATTFRRMLGLVQGRIYYNLLSWYRVLAMLPGYKINRRFMEQMMGVKEGLPDELLDRQTPTRGARLRDALRLGRTLVGLVANFLTLSRRIDSFEQRLNRALGTTRPDLSHHRPDELVAYYRDLEGQLLTRWDAPLVNDFFAMIFYGLLRKLTESWCGDTHGTLQNALLADTGNIISAEPANRMRHLARLAAVDASFIDMLCGAPLPEILLQMPHLPEFEAEYRAYLDKFGDRCLEELKLESPTLHDDPLILLRSVGQLAKTKGSKGAGEPFNKAQDRQGSRRSEDKSSITNYQYPTGTSLPITNLPRRIIFNWALKTARTLIRNRENLRFERTRLFGRARQIFVQLGHRFYALDLLTDPRDIFYLEVEEALGLVDGTATTTDLKGLVALRKAEFERYQQIDPPPGRIETRGIPHIGFKFHVSGFGVQSRTADTELETSNSKPETLTGLGCSPGVVRGPVRIITDPKSAALQPGEILVAERTDPGWIMLFPLAVGLLVEHGSLLSHSAIVSREMGLPAIVSVKGVTHRLKDGDWVEFDGSTGEVKQIDQPLQMNGKE